MPSHPIQIEKIELQHASTNRFTISDYIDLVPVDEDSDSPLNPSPSPSSAPAPTHSFSPQPPFKAEPTPASPPPHYSTSGDPFFSFSSAPRSAPAPPSTSPPSAPSPSSFGQPTLRQERPPRVLVSPEPRAARAAPVVTVTSPTPATASRPAFFRDRSGQSDRSDSSTAPLVTPFPLPPQSETSSDMRCPGTTHPPLHSISTDYLGRGPEPQRSPDGSGEYVPQLTYPPRTEQRYRPDVEVIKDERRLSASTIGSKRESTVPQQEQPRRRRNKFSVWLDRFIPQSLACRLLVLVVTLEMLIDVAIQANILWRYTEEQHSGAVDSDDYNARRLPIYLCIFVSAHILQLILTVFAIRTRNTIQVIALAVFNAMLLAYAGIEVAEIRQTLDVNPASEEVASAHKLLTLPLNILTGIVIGVIGLAEVIIVVLTYFVWREFGWRIYKFLGADLRIRTYYRQYQVFESIVCCSFFFFMSFSVQFLFLILNNEDPEYVLTWIMLPLSFFWLGFGLLCARREWRIAMGVFLVGLLAGMAYFIFKLVRVWQNVALYYKLGYGEHGKYRRALDLASSLVNLALRDVDTGNSLMDTVKSYYSVRKSLTVFSALSLVMICLCIGYGVVVWLNFGKGLREHVDEGRKPGFMADLAPPTFKPVSSNPASPSRLTIE